MNNSSNPYLTNNYTQIKSILPHSIENQLPNHNFQNNTYKNLFSDNTNNLYYASYDNLIHKDPFSYVEKKQETKSDNLRLQILEEKMRNMEAQHHEEKNRLLEIIRRNIIIQQDFEKSDYDSPPGKRKSLVTPTRKDSVEKDPMEEKIHTVNNTYDNMLLSKMINELKEEISNKLSKK
jgi:hypothetical protein